MKLTSLLPLLVAALATAASAQTIAPVVPAITETPQPQYKVILTEAQTERILKELDKVEALIGKGRGGVFAAALAKFREGLASPSAALGLYLECYKLEHFDRKNLKMADFTDWRNKNEAKLKDEDFKRALLLQLEYLVLTIQGQDVEQPKKMASIVAAIQAFLGKEVIAIQGTTTHSASGAVADKDSKGGRKGGNNVPAGDILGTLRQSVAECIFAKAYSLQDFLKREEWEYEPLNVKGIYNNIIFPYFLAEKPTDLPAQWDARIAADVAIRKALMSETEYNEYNREAGPRLLWEKGNYLVVNDVNAVNAMADMLKVIQTYPSHPDANAWLKEFRELVQKVSPAGSVPEKPAAQ